MESGQAGSTFPSSLPGLFSDPTGPRGSTLGSPLFLVLTGSFPSPEEREKEQRGEEKEPASQKRKGGTFSVEDGSEKGEFRSHKKEIEN